VITHGQKNIQLEANAKWHFIKKIEKFDRNFIEKNTSYTFNKICENETDVRFQTPKNNKSNIYI